MGLGEAFAEALGVEQHAIEAYEDLLPRVAGDARRSFATKSSWKTKHVHEAVEAMRAGAPLKVLYNGQP